MPYFTKAVMFGDGRNGAATQVRAVHWGDGVSTETIDTGIRQTWSRKDRKDQGTVVYTHREKTGTARELIDAWAKENGKEPLK